MFLLWVARSRTLRTLRLTDYDEKEIDGSMQRIISKWFLFEKNQTNTGNMLIIMISVFHFHLCLRFVSYFFLLLLFLYLLFSIPILHHSHQIFSCWYAEDCVRNFDVYFFSILLHHLLLLLCLLRWLPLNFGLIFFHFWSGHRQTEFIVVLISLVSQFLVIIFLSLLLRSIVFRSKEVFYGKHVQRLNQNLPMILIVGNWAGTLNENARSNRPSPIQP